MHVPKSGTTIHQRKNCWAQRADIWRVWRDEVLSSETKQGQYQGKVLLRMGKDCIDRIGESRITLRTVRLLVFHSRCIIPLVQRYQNLHYLLYKGKPGPIVWNAMKRRTGLSSMLQSTLTNYIGSWGETLYYTQEE